ncbi:hypothetical protein RJ639_025903 [Escallonia herrerae]|uniref:Bet v I/Major latex protein domain-containing protein n=2 Tax=Escallonia herrerae TaxID=1293975 RepID=A0AA88S6A5_9ASTE|nr:hypothetical protein RJ639_025903 [Escallonia herrerae]
MKTFGAVSAEMNVDVPASSAWELYGTLDLTKITVPKYLASVEVVQGDGGEGTITKLTPLTGSAYCEKFTKVDNENLVKETEIVEGGFLDLGFNLYRVRFENVKTGENSCITRTTIEYDVKEESAANISDVNIVPSINIMKDVAAYLATNDGKSID